MPIKQKLKQRYDIKEPLGEGGMGIVYRAYDKKTERDVALKTLLDIQDSTQLELFYKECQLLKTLSHPNIVELFDIGEFEEEGERKPYFVMPLLKGVTLRQLIQTSSQRLSVTRAVDIISQTCRGLHAAHESGLVHRDLKPSNIFVMEDDSVKIIDFGVAHVVDMRSGTSRKGTLAYMSPEQIEMKPVSASCDIFSLGVVCYEALTRHRPFEGRTEEEMAGAILHYIPPPASDFNPELGPVVSRVIHKAMAKQPWHRFSTAREFAETLQKAMRNEPIEILDPVRIQPRIQRASKAFQQADYQFAAEILSELEAEGYMDPAIVLLRRQLDQAVRQKKTQQLIESARTRYEEGEYPLALQKLQEASQLDPDNTEAAGLKKVIETKRSDQKIEDWFRLARQHIDNFAYSHACQALQNVLQLRPRDAQALQLLSEVQRREQEYLKVRREKVELYDNAVDAWQKGEVSTALSRLKRVLELEGRAPDLSAPNQATSYRNFYNEVRSEHDAINNAYAEARKHLADREFAKAMAICDRYLSKYPGHALIQALRFDVEERQRQELSALIAETDRRVEVEADLERRSRILEEALERYPGEVHFKQALRLVRDKRDLVNSIVAKAHLLEEHGQFTEALGQWEIVKTIHGQYPGLDFQIERLVKRRDQQLSSEAKARWVEQIDHQLASGEFTRALDLLRGAQAEFSNDAELLELAKLAREGIERSAEAQRLLAQGQELCARQRFDEGLDILRRAHRLDERNGVVQAVLADTLGEQARVVLDHNWHSAESLIQEALELDSTHTLARSLRTLVLDRKRQEFVDRCLFQARQLQRAGDLKGANATVREALLIYPGEPKLIQLQTTLSKALQDVKHRDLERIQRLAEEAEAAADSSVLAPLSDRASSIAQQYPDDGEFQSVIAGIKERLGTTISPVEAGSSRLGVQNNVRFRSGANRGLAAVGAAVRGRGVNLVPRVRELMASATNMVRRKPQVSSEVSVATVVPGILQRKSLRWLLAGLAVTALALVLVPIMIRTWNTAPPPPPPAPPIPIEISVTPPDATVRINGKEYSGGSNLRVDLPAGTYRLEAVREGYHLKAETISVAPGFPTVYLNLLPMAPNLRVFTDLDAGKVGFDEQPVIPLQDGGFSLDSLEAGRHKVRISAPRGEATIEFEVVPGSPPRLIGLPQFRELMVLVVSNMGTVTRVYSSMVPAKFSLDDKPLGDVGPDGFELKDLTSGNHTVTIGEGKDSRQMDFEISSVPTLSARLISDRNVGDLLVVTGESGVQIYLNDQMQRRETQGGQLRIPNLAVKEYFVRVSKAGFQSLDQQRAQIRKGETTQIIFTFPVTPPPAVEAYLSIQLGMGLPETEVWLDQVRLGTLQNDGSFSERVIPGSHVIELRRKGHKPKSIQKHFGPGEKIQLTASDVSFEPSLARLRLLLSPNSAVRIKKEGEEQARQVEGTELEVLEGSYELTATADNHRKRSEPVTVAPGETREVDLRLSRETVEYGMNGWENPIGWRREGTWYIHKGGNFVPYRITPMAGSLSFTWLRQSGFKSFFKNQRLQWVIGHTDDKNYALLETDGENFYRSLFVNGKVSKAKQVPMPKPPQKDQYHFQIVIEPGRILHQLLGPEKWINLDEWNDPGQNFVKGKFGLLIPGGNQVSIGGLKFLPR